MSENIVNSNEFACFFGGFLVFGCLRAELRAKLRANVFGICYSVFWCLFGFCAPPRLVPRQLRANVFGLF